LLLKLFLDCFKAPGLLFLEEDLEIAPDFFNYFEAVTPLMNRDPSIYCVSAWNDHGQRGRVKDNRALYRTDVMPGLGWYLNSKIGLELAPKWPMTNWDDWMRLPGIKNGRSCIYPEVRACVGLCLAKTRCPGVRAQSGCVCASGVFARRGGGVTAQ
jgi:alpha-1,3-mannosyl-glycoprotein beta-1,2-N-acetylglucosaminyltransferase